MSKTDATEIIIVGKARQYRDVILAIFRHQQSNTIHELNKDELLENGYRPGEPHWAGSFDKGICARTKCPVCNHHGMDYEPYVRDNPRSYRAFGVCPQCGSSFEF